MSLSLSRRALVACSLFLPTLLGACADANPSPTPLPPPSPSPSAAPTGAPPANTSAPGGGQVTEATPTGVTAGSAFQPGPCKFKAWLTVDTSCGTLTVPEDHRQPSGRKIKLAVATFKSSSSYPAPDPVLYLQGGPGDSVFGYGPDFYPLLALRDVLLLEQRGVGLSQPALDCPEMDKAVETIDQQGVRGSTDPGPFLPAAIACRDRLTKTGVNLANYNTTQSAADVEALRQALGYKEWNLFGVSYGTRLALTVMRDFPAGVRSAILDSPLPPQASIADRPGNVAAAFDRVFVDCAADAACNRAYPNLKQVFSDTVDQLNKEPVQFAIGPDRMASITGDRVIGVAFGALDRGQTIAELPRAIYAARKGDLIPLFRFGTLGVGTGATGLLYTVWCGELVLPAGQDKLAAADKAYPQLHHIFSQLDTLAVCKQWGVPPAPASEQQPVQSTIPSLILSGRYDARTPPAYAEETARTLKNSHLFTFPGQGHGATQEPCALTIAASFVNNPSTAPASECYAGMTAPEWDIAP